MRHFIAYHNTEKMGRRLHDGEPLRLLTNKHVNHLLQNMVWFITGEGAGARQYSLGSVFRVAEVGDAAEDGFKRFAAGPPPSRPLARLGDRLGDTDALLDRSTPKIGEPTIFYLKVSRLVV